MNVHKIHHEMGLARAIIILVTPLTLLANRSLSHAHEMLTVHTRARSSVRLIISFERIQNCNSVA